MFGKADVSDLEEPEDLQVLIPEDKKEEAKSFFNCFSNRNNESMDASNDPEKLKIEQQIKNKMEKLESAQQRYNDLKEI